MKNLKNQPERVNNQIELTIPTRDPKESERVTMETTMCVNQAQSYSVFVVYNFTSPYIDYFWLVFGV